MTPSATVIGESASALLPNPRFFKLNAMSILRSGSEKSDPNIHEIIIGKQIAHRKFAPDGALTVRVAQRPHAGAIGSTGSGTKSAGFFRPSMRVTNKAALAPNLLPTNNKRVLLFLGVGSPPQNTEKSATANKLPRILAIPANHGRVSGTGVNFSACTISPLSDRSINQFSSPTRTPSHEDAPPPRAAVVRRPAKYSENPADWFFCHSD